MPDSEKWTAHRGSQGDDWQWEGEPPAKPAGSEPAPGGPRVPSAGPEKPVRRVAASFLAAMVALASGIWALVKWPFRKLGNGAAAARKGASRQDLTGLLVLIGALSLVAAAAVIGVFLATALDEDDSRAAPRATATTPAGETRTPTPRPSATATAGALVPPDPDGEVALAMWANELEAWWFGVSPEGSALYDPGDEVPWLLRWEAELGEAYEVTISYECLAPDGPMIDLLRGAETTADEVFEAEWGPGKPVPEAAVPIPDTPDSPVDDGAPGLLYLYGGKFTLLPSGPEPAAECQGERSITVPVEATTDVVLMLGSARLAAPGDHGGASAADTAFTIEMRVAVSGTGTARAGLAPGVVTSE